MNAIRVLLCDDDPYLLKRHTACLEADGQISVVATASNGEEALKLIDGVRPDVVVLDLIMPLVDGFEILSRLQWRDECRPRVIVLSGLTGDGFVTRAMALGAAYYMAKPCEPRLLRNRIMELDLFVPDHLPPARGASNARSLQPQASELLRSVGIPAALKGMRYLCSALYKAAAYDAISGRITKEIYPSVAREFGAVGTQVERAIRHAIQRGWERGTLRDCGLFDPNHKPTNGEFIARVAECLRV